jgi:hypothetical protein
MIKNCELSKKLRNKYQLKENQCIYNSFKLCIHEKLELCIGFIEDKNKKIYLIHIWNIYKNKIIDSTIPENKYNYIEIAKSNYKNSIKKNLSGSNNILKFIMNKFTILYPNYIYGFEDILYNNFIKIGKKSSS